MSHIRWSVNDGESRYVAFMDTNGNHGTGEIEEWDPDLGSDGAYIIRVTRYGVGTPDHAPRTVVAEHDDVQALVRRDSYVEDYDFVPPTEHVPEYQYYRVYGPVSLPPPGQHHYGGRIGRQKIRYVGD